MNANFSHGFRFHQTRLRKLAFEDDAFVTTKPPSADHGGTEITDGARRRRMNANFSVKPPCYSVSPWSAEAAFEGARTRSGTKTTAARRKTTYLCTV